MLTYGVDAWIRINQLGYLPNAQKKAILISESFQQIKQFTIHDALTNEELGSFNSVVSKGEFQSYISTYILDFSKFKTQGAFYIKAGLIYSPTIFINKNTYLGGADFLLNYIRQQRCGLNTTLNNECNGYETTGEEPKPIEINTVEPKPTSITTTSATKKVKLVRKVEEPEIVKQKYLNVKGGWHNGSDYIQFGATTATAVYQLLFAYQMNPKSFTDNYDTDGNPGANHIPDILDEAKWGLDWLLKMSPSKDVLYHQIGDDRESVSNKTPYQDKADNSIGVGTSRPVFLATGKPQGLSSNKSQSTGMASIAGKYSSAFGLGAEIIAKFNPKYADSLKVKALETYELGKQHPGVCQSVPGRLGILYAEDNWTDDMELAAAQLYHLTYEGKYLKEATGFGRMEPITPWMCSDTAKHYQWYPFINLGHYMLANVENPRFQKEFSQDLLNGIQRMQTYASTNPFNIGIPLITCSNSLVTALASQCRLYRTLTNDSTYADMETALVDWLFGRNPWGTSMVVGLPKIGKSPTDTHSTLWYTNHIGISGGLINGPVQEKVFKNQVGIRLSKVDAYERFQSSWAVYHDNSSDYLTNAPTLDGTASLTYLLSSKQQEGVPEKTSDHNEYTCGGITRTDNKKKQISLVFSGHEYADGYKIIRKTLQKLNIKASFFFTGDFYRKGKFRSIIKGLQDDKHYLGAHSDNNLLYCSWQKRDSLLVTKSQFLNDIKANYMAMEKFGIYKDQTPFFLPSNEWYNDSISLWCKEIGIQLINFTPGTLSNLDYSVPEMRSQYFSSNEIYNKVIQTESKQGLNGNILLFHIGTDKRRQDKFYPKLYSLLIAISKAGYEFVDLYQATDAVGKNIVLTDKKQKRKN
jgi:peptidoglycan/xylan/chitin deacetylase (PgdA/CDA1 family)